MSALIRKPWFTVVIAVASLFVFGHMKNFFGWVGGYISYNFVFFILGLLYSYSNLPHRTHILVIILAFALNFFNLYTGSKYVYYPVPALGLAVGAILSYCVGRIWLTRQRTLSVLVATLIITSNIIFCNWLPSYFYDFRVNLPAFEYALHKDVSLDFTDLDGKRIDKSLWKNKVVVIDFWYLQCGWCIEKMVLLDKVHHHFRKNSNVQIVSVIDGSIDTREDVKKFIGKYKSSVPILYDPEGSFIKKYQLGTQGYPVEIKVSKTGSIQEVLLGLWSFEEVYVNESIKRITALL